MKHKATIAEILHTKDPKKFATLIAQLIQAGLISPQSAAGGPRFGSVEGTILTGSGR